MKVADVKVGEQYGYLKNGWDKNPVRVLALETAVAVTKGGQPYRRASNTKKNGVKVRFLEAYDSGWSTSNRNVGDEEVVEGRQLIPWDQAAAAKDARAQRLATEKEHYATSERLVTLLKDLDVQAVSQSSVYAPCVMIDGENVGKLIERLENWL